jgi:hypothetical protein
MSVPFCALCNQELTPDNDSREHIVPESIGGRRRVKGFLCIDCNSRAGEKWDSVTARQLNALCLLFAIQRQTGTVRTRPLKTESGQIVRLHADGHLSLPDTQPAITIDGSEVKIQAPRQTTAEVRKMLRGLERRYPQLDVEQAMQNATEQRSYLSEPVRETFNFGGHESGRSVVKSALALAVDSGIKAPLCEEATECLRNEGKAPCFGYFYKRDLVRKRPSNRVFHCVAIKAEPSSQRLIGYVELFSLYRMVVCLSSRYTGDPLFRYYAIDPSTGQELDLDVDVSLSEEEVSCAFANTEDYAANLAQTFQNVFTIGQAISFDRERATVIERALKECIAQLGLAAGDTLTAEDALALSKCLATRMEPFLNHLVLSIGRTGRARNRN